MFAGSGCTSSISEISVAMHGKLGLGKLKDVIHPCPTQAEAMTRLGGQLAERDMTLAYHFHSPAWQNDGREFHQLMMTTTTMMKRIIALLDVEPGRYLGWVMRLKLEFSELMN